MTGDAPKPAVDSSGNLRLAVLLAMAMFVLVVDTSIMNVSISSVVHDLDTDVSSVQAAIALEALVSAAFILIGSKVADLIGRKRAYVLGLLGYAVGAISMALAQSVLVVFVFWAIIGGIGASLLQSLDPAARKRVAALARAGLRDDHWWVRHNAWVVLGAFDIRKDAYLALQAELADASGEQLAIVVRALASLYVGDEKLDRQTETIVKKHLSHRDVRVRAASIGALGPVGLGDKEWKRLKAAATDPEELVRIAAMRSMGTVTKRRDGRSASSTRNRRIEMEWSPEATEKFKALLGEIPVFLRPMAEQMGKNEIGKVATAKGVVKVDIPTMVVGLINATPAHLKDQMKEAMVKHGIDLAAYKEFL